MKEAIMEKLVKKWRPMTKHIRSDESVKNTSVILETQQRYFEGKLTEDTMTGDIAKFKPIAMPLVARVFPELVTNELVDVQPLTTPVGLAYALRYKYASGAEAGQEAGYNTVNSLYSKSYDGATDHPEKEVLGEYAQFGGVANPEPMRYMNLGIENREIHAETRKLAARWSMELQQDLQNMQAVDIASEMSDLLAYEVAAEIDAELKNAIIVKAQIGGVYTWSYGNSGAANGTADGRWEQEKFRTLYTMLLNASQDIARSTRRGSANFVIVSNRVATALQALPDFLISPVDASMNTENVGVAKIGKIGPLTVYRDVFAVKDYAVVGYKGTRKGDSGIIYCPYVPLMFAEGRGQDSLFNSRIGVMTRYGMVDNLFGSELFYRYIDVNFTPDSGEAGTLGQPKVPTDLTGMDTAAKEAALTSPHSDDGTFAGAGVEGAIANMDQSFGEKLNSDNAVDVIIGEDEYGDPVVE